MIAKLQYISQSTPQLTHLQAIETACAAGCKWIQLRMKDNSEEEIIETALAAKVICQNYHAVFVLNDYPIIAQKVVADGVHLGLTDFNHLEARKLLGSNVIIGGTANTIEDIRNYAQQGAVDYVGVGPFRFTTTKKNLSPILGLEGYTTIVKQCQQEGIKLPIFAIGGITVHDVPALMATGIHGIAVSGLITNAEQPFEMVQDLLDKVGAIESF
jgi:thiamine-phosphate pyrophosphorylase